MWWSSILSVVAAAIRRKKKKKMPAYFGLLKSYFVALYCFCCCCFCNGLRFLSFPAFDGLRRRSYEPLVTVLFCLLQQVSAILQQSSGQTPAKIRETAQFYFSTVFRLVFCVIGMFYLSSACSVYLRLVSAFSSESLAMLQRSILFYFIFSLQ